MENENRKGFGSKVWQVHKFGGTSVADASCFLKAASIVENEIGIGTDNDNGIGSNSDSDIAVDEETTGMDITDIGNPSSSSSTKAMTSKQHLAVVVSAMGGKPKVTDLLLNSVKAASERDEAKVNASLDLILRKHTDCLENLDMIPDVDRKCLREGIEQDIGDIRDILKTVSLMKWQATRISELVSGYGETWSAQILCALLSTRSLLRDQSNGLQLTSRTGLTHEFVYMDARRVITIDEDAIKDGAVCWDLSLSKLQTFFNQSTPYLNSTSTTTHLVITGYVASNTHGVATTLQRDGSDYSAAIMGRLLQSNNITIWTDVDGVLSADPRRVPDSYVLPEVSFNEAMELAYFGAKVIHPKTMQPAIMAHPQIPIYIRNTFRSDFRGSRIYTSSTTHTDRDRCVCGFSSVEKMALVNVEGSGMIGVKGVARRLFGTLEGMGVNVVLISQASSEHSITFATTMKQAEDAKVAIEEEFHKEISNNHISAIEIQKPCSIIAAVGDGMHFTTGVAGRFFSALGDAKINILAISQGSSERNISAVVLESESTRALRAVHAAFRLSHTNVRLGVVGMNEIGYSLVKLLETQREKLRAAFELDLQLCAILPDGNSLDVAVLQNGGMAGNADSITISSYDSATGGSFLLGAPATSANMAPTVSFQDCQSLENKALVEMQPGGLESFRDHVFSEDCAHTTIFDCTADENVGKKHVDWLGAGVNIITANNTALSGSKSVRDAIAKMELTGSKKTKYLREVTVGGGLPIISTLNNLLNSGDKIRRMDGILSVTMSYIMHRVAPPPGIDRCTEFDEAITLGAYRGDLSMSPKNKLGETACSFSQAVREAIALGLTEEDPIKDISNEYTARCLMVLAKELGLDAEYDVRKIQSQSESLIPNGVKHYSEVAEELDTKMRDMVANAAAERCVPRHLFSVDVKTRRIEIKVVNVPENHVFATSPPSCECVRFFTQRHKQYPLIVQGPSAGADSTASALLAELLNLMRNKVGPRSGALSRTTSSAFLA